MLTSSGRLDEASVEGQRALELDLLSPTMNVHVGWNHFFARRYVEVAPGGTGMPQCANGDPDQRYFRSHAKPEIHWFVALECVAEIRRRARG